MSDADAVQGYLMILGIQRGLLAAMDAADRAGVAIDPQTTGVIRAAAVSDVIEEVIVEVDDDDATGFAPSLPPLSDEQERIFQSLASNNRPTLRAGVSDGGAVMQTLDPFVRGVQRGDDYYAITVALPEYGTPVTQEEELLQMLVRVSTRVSDEDKDALFRARWAGTSSAKGYGYLRANAVTFSDQSFKAAAETIGMMATAVDPDRSSASWPDSSGQYERTVTLYWPRWTDPPAGAALDDGLASDFPARAPLPKASDAAPAASKAAEAEPLDALDDFYAPDGFL